MRAQKSLRPPRNPRHAKGTLVAKRQKPPDEVFLNIPYDHRFERPFLAFISGISAFGLVPPATLEITSSTRRLDRILHLIRDCRYSIHDLSRVEIDGAAPRTPRFNMPFELGLSVAHQKASKGKKHEWFVCESKNFRLTKSLSDLNGTDPFIHDGRIDGLFRELCNMFRRPDRQPSVQQMARIYRELRRNLPIVLRQTGSPTPYRARVFKDLCVTASAAADTIVT
jgi:hypothetical protein